MAKSTNELNNLDFSSLIGGPIQAAVAAQNSASLAQVEFIKSVGIDDQSNIQTVTFFYNNQVQGEASTDNQDPSEAGTDNQDPGEASADNKVKIIVPLLSMLNVPSLRIEEMTIDFNAKINSVETSEISSALNVEGDAALNIGKIINLKASAAYKKTNTSGLQVDKNYSMAIHVKVVNDDLPAGLDRLLNLLETSVASID